MEKYRIELVKYGSYKKTIVNTDTKLSTYELTKFMNDWFDCENCDRDRDDYFLQLVDNETNDIIRRAY